MLKIVEFTGDICIVLSVVFATIILPQLEKYTMSELREKAKEFGLVSIGAKAELIARITKADLPRKIIDDESQKIIQRVDNLRECEIEIY